MAVIGLYIVTSVWFSAILLRQWFTCGVLVSLRLEQISLYSAPSSGAFVCKVWLNARGEDNAVLWCMRRAEVVSLREPGFARTIW